MSGLPRIKGCSHGWVSEAMGRRFGALAAVLLIGSGSLTPAWGGEVLLPQAIGGSYRLPVQSLREARFAATVRQQFDFSCGSAALSTLLTHHYGRPVSEQQAFEGMFSQGDVAQIQQRGFSLLDMKRFLSTLDLASDGYVLDLDRLQQAGLPAIALIEERGFRHFVVIKGVQGDRVLLGDPAEGTRVLSRERFEAAWPSRIVFVILGETLRGRFNDPSDWAARPQAPLAQAGAFWRAASFPKLGPSDF